MTSGGAGVGRGSHAWIGLDPVDPAAAVVGAGRKHGRGRVDADDAGIRPARRGPRVRDHHATEVEHEARVTRADLGDEGRGRAGERSPAELRVVPPGSHWVTIVPSCLTLSTSRYFTSYRLGMESRWRITTRTSPTCARGARHTTSTRRRRRHRRGLAARAARPRLRPLQVLSRVGRLARRLDQAQCRIRGAWFSDLGVRCAQCCGGGSPYELSPPAVRPRW